MTGTVSGSQFKKRKHRPSEGLTTAVDGPHKREEKRHKVRETTQPATTPSEGALLQKRKPKSPKGKGKLRSSDWDLPSDFCTVNASLVLSIPPVFASDLRAGAEEMLDSMVMRYIPSLQGVLLSHSNVRFLRETANIHGDCPFAVCNVSFDATLWAPRISMKLVGRISLCSPDHISLLVHRTFNVSIPRHHIPQEQWVFEYGPAENDPEFGEGGSSESKSAADADGGIEAIDSTTLKASEERGEEESSGRWVHHLTGLKLGGPDGYVEFTVIGLTVANEMLSLQGSIQSDPFSLEHIPHSNKVASSPDFYQHETPEVEIRDKSSGEEEEESGEDGFKHLARLTDEAQAKQKAKRAQEEAEQEKAKKRKQRVSRGDDDEDARRSKKAKAEKKRKKGAVS